MSSSFASKQNLERNTLGKTRPPNTDVERLSHTFTTLPRAKKVSIRFAKRSHCNAFICVLGTICIRNSIIHSGFPYA